MIKDFYPQNRLQEFLNNRFVRLSWITFFWVIAFVFSFIFSVGTSEAASVAIIRVDETVNPSAGYVDGVGTIHTTPPQDTFKRFTMEQGNIPLQAVITKIEAKWVSKGSNSYNIKPTNRTNGFGDITPLAPSCSGTPASATVYTTRTCDWTSASALTIDFLNNKLGITMTRNNSASTINVDAIYLEVTYYVPLQLEILTSPIYPNTEINMRVSWNNNFFFPDQVKYAYFLPYGRHYTTGCDGECVGSNEFGKTVVNGSAQPDGLTGSGSINFTYSYPYVGSFTGSIVLSSNCNITQLNEDDGMGDCDALKADAIVTVGGFSMLTPSQVALSVDSWNNGGSTGSNTGNYLATNKRVYQISEPVYLKWRYNIGGLIVSSVKIFNDIGGDLVATVTASEDITQDEEHYANIFYDISGQYNPYIRICVGDCSTIFYDMYIGGDSQRNPSYSITVLDSLYQVGASIGGGDCTTTGIFGMDPEYFRVSFGENSNIFYQGVNELINKSIQSLLWIGGETMCVLENAPMLGIIDDIISPQAGTYNLPTSIMGNDINPSQVFGDDSFLIEYSSDAGITPLANLIKNSVLIFVIGFFILKNIFPKK